MTETPGRWRLRFSLLTSLLLLTIAALTVTVWRQSFEIEPLRQEVRQLRTETGQLTIDDPTKAYAISVPTFEDDSWKWRIYLPPGSAGSINERSGRLPPRSKFPGASWFKEVMDHGSGGSSSGSSIGGEFVLEAKLVKEDGWVLATRYRRVDGDSGSTGSGKTSLYPSDWLADRRSRSSTSDVSATKQKEFDPGEPILLLHMVKPIITETPGGGYSSRMPDGVADGFVLWIE